jgi:hypothetical protein
VARPYAEGVLREITETLKDEVSAQTIARRSAYLKHAGIDLATITRSTLSAFSRTWLSLEERLCLVPGKDVLKAFRDRVQDEWGVTLTDSRIVDAMRLDEFPDDLRNLLERVESFRTSTL